MLTYSLSRGGFITTQNKTLILASRKQGLKTCEAEAEIRVYFVYHRTSYAKLAADSARAELGQEWKTMDKFARNFKSSQLNPTTVLP